MTVCTDVIVVIDVVGGWCMVMFGIRADARTLPSVLSLETPLLFHGIWNSGIPVGEAHTVIGVKVRPKSTSSPLGASVLESKGRHDYPLAIRVSWDDVASCQRHV